MVNHAIIVAAGEGRRFGQEKQFYTFQGRPLLLYSIDPFEESPEIHSITIVVSKNRISYTKSLIKKRGYKKIHRVVAGGKLRQNSVRNGLKAIKAKSGIVVIHDGVRPFITHKIIKRGIKLCKKYGAAICGVPVYDTIKEVRRHHVIRTIPRSDLYLIQTPQFFKLNLIKEAFKRVDQNIEYTDEAVILESLGIPVYIFQGDRFNVKITEKSDLKIFSQRSRLKRRGILGQGRTLL
jgi:2-C-methyl-D-erythritol 4-phosphate cytidylyltransferase